MPKIAYQNKRFNKNTLEVIDQANSIIEEYAEQGFKLTLRQLYYQFVARDLIPNKVSEYKRLGIIINDARLAGLIDWEMIEDRTRNLKTISSWNSPSEIINIASEQFKMDLWKNQKFRVEVWIEKEALAGVFEPICNELRVPFFSCRGYTSQSEMWGASIRLLNYDRKRQRPIILHFGDHDPSGIDMTRDIFERMEIFGCHFIEIRRLALNFDQIEQYSPPPNPAKETDSRFKAYLRKYGNESWEIDALEPQVLSRLVSSEISTLIDERKWIKALKKEKAERKKILNVSNNWKKVEKLFSIKKNK